MNEKLNEVIDALNLVVQAACNLQGRVARIETLCNIQDAPTPVAVRMTQHLSAAAATASAPPADDAPKSGKRASNYHDWALVNAVSRDPYKWTPKEIEHNTTKIGQRIPYTTARKYLEMEGEAVTKLKQAAIGRGQHLGGYLETIKLIQEALGDDGYVGDTTAPPLDPNVSINHEQAAGIPPQVAPDVPQAPPFEAPQVAPDVPQAPPFEAPQVPTPPPVPQAPPLAVPQVPQAPVFEPQVPTPPPAPPVIEPPVTHVAPPMTLVQPKTVFQCNKCAQQTFECRFSQDGKTLLGWECVDPDCGYYLENNS